MKVSGCRKIAVSAGEVARMIRSAGSAAASLAPSYVCAFPGVEPGGVVAGLKMLGFGEVEETASVLPRVFESRRRLLETGNRLVISNSCPRIVRLVTEEFPHLECFLADSLTPMHSHCLDLRRRTARPIVFIGPCRAKVLEAERQAQPDAVLSFAALQAWFAREGIDPARLHPAEPDVSVPQWALVSLLAVDVSGMEDCRKYFGSLDPRDCEPRFVEALACQGGCLYGDGMPDWATGDRRSKLIRYIRERDAANGGLCHSGIRQSVQGDRRYGRSGD